jgi:hypothetical protein
MLFSLNAKMSVKMSKSNKEISQSKIKYVFIHCTYPSTMFTMLFSLNMKMSIISLYLICSAGGWNENISRSAKGGREGGGASTQMKSNPRNSF